ncbi:AAA family ATPase [Algoriphagus namhaensis]
MNSKHDIILPGNIPGFVVLDLICESPPHILYRATRQEDERAVVIKTLFDKYPKKEYVASLRREHQIIRQLQAKGVIEALDLLSYGNGNLALILEPFGVSLEDFAKQQAHNRVSIDDFLRFAPQLVKSLAQVHEHGIIHKDLAPRNILIKPGTLEIKLIDFSAASQLRLEHQEGNYSSAIIGSLPYMSPEQTGRMNRDIDYRSDYYSLGISFFQLLTGNLPFQASDALEWVHCHISKSAVNPQSLRKDIPAALAKIVLKLISKNAEDRYQSSYGLIADLEQVAEAYHSGDFDFDFPLAQSDKSSQFHLPQKLYGREAELKTLNNYFKSAAQGGVEFCLVSGYSGVGKSVLVYELGRSIVQHRGYLIHGKFEQFRQNSAYIALANAFRDLIRQLLGESKDKLEEWARKIKGALEPNAQLIIDLIPELELIIGKQPAVQELTPAEAQNRFLLLFTNFVKVFASKEHPLVIFLDDLQWTDIPTLNLISRLVISQELHHLMIIGAYRDNAVDSTHPLTLTLEDIRKKRPFEDLILLPLPQRAVDEIIRDTLQLDDERSAELGRILHEKTGGNPFFTIELLKTLHQRGVIYFNSQNGHWDWDTQKVEHVGHTDNVIDFLLSSLELLEDRTQAVLQLAASIGANFDLKTLSVIRESSMEKTAQDLYPAIKNNIIIPLSGNYRLVGISPDEFEAEVEEGKMLNPVYKFQHDRVQQAAYSMISPEKRKAFHLSIGRLMYSHTSADALDEKLMNVVGHLNEGRDFIETETEKRELAELNIKAGIKAKLSSAYESALSYLKISEKLLPQTVWEEDYRLMWKLAGELQSCYYLTGDWDRADEWTEIMLMRAKSEVEKGLVLSARTRQYATIGRMQDSIKAAYEGLSILGFDFIKVPESKDLEKEVEEISRNLGERSIASLIDSPLLEDERARIASQLLMEIFPAAFLSGSGNIFPYLVLKSVNIALKYGNSPETAFAYAGYAMILEGFYHETAKSYEYGKLAVNLIESFEDISLRSRILYVYTMFVHHWSNHWSTMTPIFRRAIEAGYQSGDLLYLAYSAQDCVIWDPTLDLDTASREQRKLMKIVKECEYQDSYDSGTLFLQMQLNFQGLTADRFSMTDENFDEAECLQGMFDRHFMTGIANYHIYKAEIHLMYNDPEGAFPHVLEQEKLMSSVMSLPQSVRFHFVSFVVRGMVLPGFAQEEQEPIRFQMHQSLRKMTEWAAHFPDNYEHLRLVMEAELLALEGKVTEALDWYEKAIAQANETSFIRDEAMIHELAARFLIKMGLSKAAEGYLEGAHYLYYRWGALRKTADMEKSYPHFKRGGTFGTGTTGTAPTYLSSSAQGDSVSLDYLDMSSVFRASQTISGELVLEKLLKATLEILIENAGAQKGLMIEQKEGQIIVQAIQGSDLSDLPEMPFYPDPSRKELLPYTLIHTALRTNTSLVVNNAPEDKIQATDPYVQSEQPRSMMCVPLSMHSQSKLLIYLENNLTHSAFSENRVKIIKLLAAQAAISIENARIYEEQEKLLKAQQRFVPLQFLKHLGHNDIAKVKLGESVSMEMSVLFSDIRDFTPLVERLSPPEVIEFLNKYYSELGGHISDRGGFIDSYAGDEILALFAVPADQAVQAGILMGQTLWRFNQESQEKGRPIINMGIGLNTGPLVLGTMGAMDRMQCTVLGDTVNLASRIENLTKLYGSQFLIGENTYLALEDPTRYSIRMVDRVAVKGKQEAIRLYEVLDAESEDRKKAKEATQSLLEEGMSAFYARRFAEANDLFSKASIQDSEDPILRLFAERSEKYLKTPPPENWRGYEVLHTK